MKTLYLHGLESTGLTQKKRAVLEKNLNTKDIDAPVFDYYEKEVENKIWNLFNDGNYDLIIGSSTGSMVAHSLIAQKPTKAILINPAFSHEIVDKLMPNLTRSRDVGESSFYVFGELDKTVPRNGTLDYLNVIYLPEDRHLIVKGMEHQIRPEEMNVIFSDTKIRMFLFK
ncbi:hypothetical protein K4L44_07870 [Halosquirtibacter laminarini]|uniref:Uncharacterized protein n=1 Tax=Halosquirtibacter laminarini TaxID=3374600 RepID=A0AC61NPQ8_9BACT|nr:hypothetical protein K4L44_07870 [Prolixibacteraceae bacterium]